MPPAPQIPTTARGWLEGTPVRALMTPDPVSIHHGRTVREAAIALADRAAGAALVVDDDGTPVGVVSRSDVLRAVTAGADGVSREPRGWEPWIATRSSAKMA